MRESERRQTYLTRVFCLIFVDQVHQEEPVGGGHITGDQTQECIRPTPWVLHSQVVGQVVLLQGVGFKAVRRPVEVVVPDAADEALSLSRAERGGVCVCGGVRF